MDDDAGNGMTFKQFFFEKAIPAQFMKACLVEYRDCSVRDIKEKYIEGRHQASRGLRCRMKNEALSAAWVRRTNPLTGGGH